MTPLNTRIKNIFECVIVILFTFEAVLHYPGLNGFLAKVFFNIKTSSFKRTVVFLDMMHYVIRGGNLIHLVYKQIYIYLPSYFSLSVYAYKLVLSRVSTQGWLFKSSMYAYKTLYIPILISLSFCLCIYKYMYMYISFRVLVLRTTKYIHTYVKFV